MANQASQRAVRVWERLTQWYGVRLAESYGTSIPADWSRVVDDSDNDTVKRALSIIRSRYIQHPPTFPQFEQAFKPSTTPVVGPGPADKLSSYVMRTFGSRLTPKQVRGPWTYVGSPNGEISGVVIPADGERTGYRVMLSDIDSPNWLNAQVAAIEGTISRELD